MLICPLLNIDRIRIEAPNNHIGKVNNNTGLELSPNQNELYETIYSLRDYFQKNNPKKYTLVIMDAILIASVIIILFAFFYFIN